MSNWEIKIENTEDFIKRWQEGGGTERANYQLFLIELCNLLDLPPADPASNDNRDNAYTFERRVVIKKPDGTVTNGFIDLYKRGCFVLEAKQSGLNLDSSGWDKAMLKAQNQADQYVRALPVDEGRPPFIIVTDVGRNIELYSEFSQSGSTYTPFPDPRNHRISLEDLRLPDIQKRLRKVWLEPLNLDPSRVAARVTRDIADQLAKLAKSLEAQGYSAHSVADFMMRTLFTMFSEDVGLLPNRSFSELLVRLKERPENFSPMMENLWNSMKDGGFSAIIESSVLRFNGGLFSESKALPLNRDQIELLIKAAKADWKYVEPAIFGTLLERALDPRERHKLGAHYTPRAYVDRLVLPTVIEPLRREWVEVQTAALTYENQGKLKEAIAEVKNFHRHLCNTLVLDPACGSGNFLYVTLEHMKRLEGEVLNLLDDLGESQGLLEMEGVTVDPHQFLGLEINPRAARIAEMVLWIGYLQWHFRTHGNINPPEPVLRDFKNIENRDALLSYESKELLVDRDGNPLTIWDGVSTKKSPLTGENIPDESVQIEQYKYINATKADWPQADYIIGNPPFIGARRIRTALGDGYLNILRKTYPNVPEHADFVMYWWDKATDYVGSGRAKKFGLITTNSLRQSFSRKVVDNSFERNKGIGIQFVIPDHPWVDSSDGAAVRIALTTVGKETQQGKLARVIKESRQGNDEIAVELAIETGSITTSLTIGADPAKAKELKANEGLASVGYQITGKGFVLDEKQAKTLSKNLDEDNSFIKPLITGRDINQSPRGLFALDLYGESVESLQKNYPETYQWVLERVKPERIHNKDKSSKDFWWLFARTRADFRPALEKIDSVYVTSLTAKHRVFTSVSSNTICDSTTVMFALNDFAYMGVLNSRVHSIWALTAGGDLGKTPRYNKSTCFESFPFPEMSKEDKIIIRNITTKINAHYKNQQKKHSKLTLTDMYNVLDKIRNQEVLSTKEKAINTQGLISSLNEMHNKLDCAILKAYNWCDLSENLIGLAGATTSLANKHKPQIEAEEELLTRLVKLNTKRAAEEASGHIRWLRPEYQNPDSAPNNTSQQQSEIKTTEEKPNTLTKTKKLIWPKNMREQVATVRNSLQDNPKSCEQISSLFKRNPSNAVQSVLDALEDIGIVTKEKATYSLGS